MNEYDLIYTGLTDEPVWVSAARAGILIDKGREITFIMETDGNRRGRVLKKKVPNVIFRLCPYFFSI